MNFRALIQVARFPVIALCVIVGLYALGRAFSLPPQDELVELLKVFMAAHGYKVVLIGAFLEALLLVGWYFPGSLIIFLAVILSPTVGDAAIAVALVTCGLFAGYTINFFLGKYGWYRLLLVFGMQEEMDRARNKLEQYGLRAVFMSYWNPGLASFTSTAAGVLQFSPKRYAIYSLTAVTGWDVFWGVVVYRMGESALHTILTWPFVFFLTIVWILGRYIDRVKTT